ncbi:hypothetical protein [Legionella maioricensis]|uniref:Uncharacterized protein n=1 Tax=Legionella maioricensis TaxID=2896528 RepID=A0A9X2CYT3_9GAMM|nr:hypothetical protein [Legionella maioricensis]MCL9683394.1 hypothetical protein [Legionella maioricensis]MCL9685910.1 hypothetical protein [Legionella maioricensis]
MKGLETHHRFGDFFDKPMLLFNNVVEILICRTVAWLDTEIYKQENKSDTLPQSQITAKNRYSFRSELIKQ